MAAPPVVKIGPAPAKKKGNDFDRFLNLHPQLKQYKTSIQQWAGEFGVPALWVAATLQFEHGFDAKGNPSNQPNAQGTGFGLGQINPKVWFGKTFTPTGETIDAKWASNPANAIAFMAYQLSQGSPASLKDAYLQNYNPGYTGTGPEGLLKGYKVTVSGATPGQKAAGGVATATAKAANYANQYAYNKSLLDPTYRAYAGRQPTPAEIKAYTDHPTSLYAIQQRLSDPALNPRFYKSPVWVTGAPSQEAVYKGIYGQDAPIDAHARDLMRQAIIHNWDQTAFAQVLRDQPGYTQTQEYKAQAASYITSYQRIYGQAVQMPGVASGRSIVGAGAGLGGAYAPANQLHDNVAAEAVDQAIRKGWTQDQWEQYLRSQPAYKSSSEFKSTNINLAMRMGLIPNETAQTMLQQVNSGG